MSIDLYLEQLTEDFRLAASKEVPKKSPAIAESPENAFIEHIKEVENYLYGELTPLSQILGITTVQLPPANRLSELQQARIYKEMESLLKAFNFYPDFPEKLPDHFRYKI